MEVEVDAQWYLETYPDVAHAGMDPVEHFCKFGSKEGRYPYNLRSIYLETALWGGFSRLALPALEELSTDSTDFYTAQHAKWVLMRWRNYWTVTLFLLLNIRNYIPLSMNNVKQSLYVWQKHKGLLAATLCLGIAASHHYVVRNQDEYFSSRQCSFRYSFNPVRA